MTNKSVFALRESQASDSPFVQKGADAKSVNVSMLWRRLRKQELSRLFYGILREKLRCEKLSVIHAEVIARTPLIVVIRKQRLKEPC